MAKADVLQLATDLSLGVADQDEMGQFYDEILREFGLREVQVVIDPIEVEPDEPTYRFTGDHVTVLEVHHDVTGRLSPSTGVSLRAAVGPNWRLQKGIPNAFTQNQASSDELTLFPIPTTPGELQVIQTVEPADVFLQNYLELPIALEILHREFMRESSHQDVEFAAMARNLSLFFFNLVNVGVPQDGS